MGAALITTVRTSLDSTLSQVRTLLVQSAVLRCAEGSTDDAQQYALNLSLPFRFALCGGNKVIRLSQEGSLRVAAALPALPRFGAPSPEFAPRFQFAPPCASVLVERSTRPQADRSQASAVRECRGCLYVVGARAEGFPAGVDGLLASRLALQLGMLGRQPTPKQLAALLNPRNSNIRDFIGRTVLHEAAAEGHVAVATFLLSLSFVDRDAHDGRGETALHIATDHGHLDVCTALLNAGIDALIPATMTAGGRGGATPLHVALRRRMDTVVDVMCRHLARRGCTIEELEAARDSEGHTPLSLFRLLTPPMAQLVEEGNLAAADALLHHLLYPRAAMCDVDACGGTLLHAAALSSSVGSVRFVIDEWTRVGRCGELSALRDSCGRTALHVAAATGDEEVAAEILMGAGVPLTTTDNAGRNALHSAAYHRRWTVLQRLSRSVDAAAALGVFDFAGLTPIHIAAAEAPVSTLEILLSLAPSAVDARASLEKRFTDRAVKTDQRPPSARQQPREYTSFRRSLVMQYSDRADIRQRHKSDRRRARHPRAEKIHQIIGPSPLWCAVHAADGTVRRNTRSVAAVDALLRSGAGRGEHDSPAVVLALVGHLLRTRCAEGAARLLKLVPADAAATDQTLLSLFCELGEADAVRWLVERGVGTGADWGQKTPYAACIARDDASTLRFLLHTAHIRAPAAALHLAIAENRTAIVGELLRSVGLSTTRVETEEDAPIAIAAAHGHDEILLGLLGYGASPGGCDRRGVPALWAALLRCSVQSGHRGSITTIARYDRCVAALIKAGAPLLAERGVYHPLEVLTLCCANGLWTAAQCVVDALLTLDPSSLHDVLLAAPELPIREFRRGSSVVRRGVMRREGRHLDRWQYEAPRCNLPFNRDTPKHRAQNRTAVSYLCAAANDAVPRELLLRCLYQLRLPSRTADVAPWLSRGDARGWTAADYAFGTGNVESIIAVLVSGALPRCTFDCARSAPLSLLHEAAQRALRVASSSQPSTTKTNSGGGDSLNGLANATLVFTELVKLDRGTYDTTIAYIAAMHRRLGTAEFDAWCTSLDALLAAVRAGSGCLVSRLLERTVSLRPTPSLGLLLAVALLRAASSSQQSMQRAGESYTDIISMLFMVWPREAHEPTPVLRVDSRALDATEWSTFRRAVGNDPCLARGADTHVMVIAAALRNAAVVSALLGRYGNAIVVDPPALSLTSPAVLASLGGGGGGWRLGQRLLDEDAGLHVAQRLLAAGCSPQTLDDWATLAKSTLYRLSAASSASSPCTDDLLKASIDALCAAPGPETVRVVLCGRRDSLLALCASTGHLRSLCRLLAAIPDIADEFRRLSDEVKETKMGLRNPLRDALRAAQPTAAAALICFGVPCPPTIRHIIGTRSSDRRRLSSDQRARVARCRSIATFAARSPGRDSLVHEAAASGDLLFVRWFIEGVLLHPHLTPDVALVVARSIAGDRSPHRGGGNLASLVMLHITTAPAELALWFGRFFADTPRLPQLEGHERAEMVPAAGYLVSALCHPASSAQRCRAVRWCRSLGGDCVSKLVIVGSNAPPHSWTAREAVRRRLKHLTFDRRLSVVSLTPIALACLMCDVELVQELLSAGAPASCVESEARLEDPQQQGGEPLIANLSTMSIAVLQACALAGTPQQAAKAVSIVRLLADRGGLAVEDAKTSSALIMALARASHLETVAALLEVGASKAIIAAPAEVGVKARRFVVALESLSQAPLLLRRHIGMYRHLMQIAAQQNASREHLIHIARHCQRGDVERAVDARGRTALYYAATACMQHGGMGDRSPASTSALDVLLGADFSPAAVCDTTKGLTPLMAAAMVGSVVGVTRIAMAADGREGVNARDKLGRTALMYAASRGHEGVVELLLELGADSSVVADGGWTASLLAIEMGHQGIALSLMKNWSSIDDLITSSTTAMHAAARSGLSEVVALLCRMPTLDPLSLIVRTVDSVSQHSALYLARAFGRAAALREMLAFVASHEDELREEGVAPPLDDAAEVMRSSASVAGTNSLQFPFGWMSATARLSEMIERRGAVLAGSPGFVGKAAARVGEAVTMSRTPSPLRRHKKKTSASSTNILRWAAESGNLVALRALSDLNIIDDVCALHAAASANEAEACRVLIALRLSDACTLDGKGRSAVWVAAETRSLQVMSVLLAAWNWTDDLELLLFGSSASSTTTDTSPKKRPRGATNLLHIVAMHDPAAEVLMDALQQHTGATSVASDAIRRALEARDASGLTPFEVAIAMGSPSAAVAFAVALHGDQPLPVPLPMDKDALLRMRWLSPSIRSLLFDVFRIPEVLTTEYTALDAASPTEESQEDTAKDEVDLPVTAAGSEKMSSRNPRRSAARVARLVAPDLRCIGLDALDSNTRLRRGVLQQIDVEHERTYAFRELVQSLSLPLKVHFRFDSITNEESRRQLFVVRRLSTSALLGRYRDALQQPGIALETVSLEFVTNRDDARTIIRGVESVDTFALADGVLVTGSAVDACEIAFAVELQQLQAEIAQLETKYTAACRAAAAAHPLLRHVRLSTDLGKELVRCDAPGRRSIARAVAHALESVSLSFVELSESALAGVTAEQLTSVVRMNTETDHAVATPPTVVLVFVPRERPAYRGREITPPTDWHRTPLHGTVPAVLVMHFDERGLTLARCREPLQSTFGAVMRADAATVHVHLLRDAFVDTRLPRALCPDDPRAAPPVRLRFEMDPGCSIIDVVPRILAETLAATVRAFGILANPPHFSSSQPSQQRPRRPALASVETQVAEAIRNGAIKMVHVTFTRDTWSMRASAQCQGNKLAIILGPVASVRAEEVYDAVLQHVIGRLISQLHDAVGTVAADAAQRLHTYVPHATLNVDVASVAAAYKDSPAEQVEALQVLVHKRGALILLPLVQALSVGWDSKIGGAIRAAVRVVHVAATATQPSSLELLADGNIVYRFNPLTTMPANGGMLPIGRRTRIGVGLLGAQALASSVIIAVAKDLVGHVDEAAAFACWSRVYLREGRVVKPGSKLHVLIESRNVFNRPCGAGPPPLGIPEPFIVFLHLRRDSATSSRIDVPIKLVTTSTGMVYRGTIQLDSMPITAAHLHAELHGQPLLGCPFRLHIVPGEVCLRRSTLKLPFDTLVVGRPAEAIVELRDSTGSRLLRGPPRGDYLRVEGPESGDVSLVRTTAPGDGTLRVRLLSKRAQIGASVLLRLVNRDTAETFPLTATVDVLSEAHYAMFREWRAGRCRDENPKRRADRIARFFRSATRLGVMAKLAEDAERLGPGVSRLDRRFPREYRAHL